MSDASEPTDILASEMQRDPAFALAVSSPERCLRVRERVGLLVVRGRSGKPSGSGGSGAGAFERELKGLRDAIAGSVGLVETDSEDVHAAGFCRPLFLVLSWLELAMLLATHFMLVRLMERSLVVRHRVLTFLGVVIMTFSEKAPFRMRLQVRVIESLDCLG